MHSPIQSFQETYRGIHGRIEMIRAVADTVGQVPVESLRRGVDAVSDFLTKEMLPLSCAEAQAQYPVVGQLLGSPDATAPMALECADLRRLAGDLEAVRARLTGAAGAERHANEARRVLYGLYELLRVHLLTEEEVYLPLLDARLSQADANHVVLAMADAEARAARR